MSSTSAQFRVPGDVGERYAEEEFDSAAVFAALDDDDCRCVLEAVTVEPLTASELADRYDIPKSTLYRKLELLTDAGLLEEFTRLCSSGKHASQYRRAFGDVTITVSPAGGLDVEITRTENDRRH